MAVRQMENHAQGEGDHSVEMVDRKATKQSLWVLWVSSSESRKGKRTWHKVTNAAWQIAMAKWNTACGWNFTENPEKVLLPVTLQFNQTRCRRCFEVMKARDKVNEGDRLAGFIIEGAGSVFNP